MFKLISYFKENQRQKCLSIEIDRLYERYCTKLGDKWWRDKLSSIKAEI